MAPPPKRPRRRKLLRRNPLVPVTRRLGQRVKPSGKVYRRRHKHARRPSRNSEETS